MNNHENSQKGKKRVTRAAPEAEYLTLDEAEIEMRMVRKTIENYALSGELHLIRIRRPGRKRAKVLIARAEIRRFMRSKTER